MNTSLRVILLCLGLPFFSVLLTGQAPSYNPAFAFPDCQDYNQRHTMWMRGINSLSFPWTTMKASLRNYEGFNFVDASAGQNLGNLNPIPTHPSVIAEFFSQNIHQSDVDNILGIGHDLGGLYLRVAAEQNPNIRALILDGVPNNGSNLIWNMIDNIQSGNPNDNSTMKRLIDQSADIMEANNSRGRSCGLVSSLQDMADEVQSAGSSYQYIQPNNPFIVNRPKLDIPILVLWGSVESDLNLGELLTASAFSITTNAYKACQDRQIRAKQKALQDEEIRSSIKESRGLLGIIGSVLGKVTGAIQKVKGTNLVNFRPFEIAFRSTRPVNWVDALSSGIGAYFPNLQSEIEEAAVANADLANLMRFRLANDLLMTEWELAIIDGSSGNSINTVNVDVITSEEYVDCMHYCALDAMGNLSVTQNACEEDCGYLLDSGTTTTAHTRSYSVFIPTEHDGILTREEMQYDGAVASIRMGGINHFDETKTLPKPDVYNLFQDIFGGAYGAAFCVPKQ